MMNKHGFRATYNREKWTVRGVSCTRVHRTRRICPSALPDALLLAAYRVEAKWWIAPSEAHWLRAATKEFGASADKKFQIKGAWLSGIEIPGDIPGIRGASCDIAAE